MLAIISLLGLAFAGTAFVNLPTSEDDSEIDKVVDVDAAELVTSDIGSLLDEPLSDLVAVTSDEYDEFFGGDGDDVANGQGGGDYLDGRDGNDTLSGGTGEDQIHGGDGDDVVSGDADDDLIYGYIGDDDMSGGDGDDLVHGGDGNDLMTGGDGDDELLGGHGDDTLIGGAGRDMIQGSEGDDVIDGATGEDVAERDYLNGSEGRDTLIGNNGDVMSGGADADRFEIVNGAVSIMDYTDEDVLVLNYDGSVPELTTETTATGTMLYADGSLVASLFGVTKFDVGTVELQRV